MLLSLVAGTSPNMRTGGTLFVLLSLVAGTSPNMPTMFTYTPDELKQIGFTLDTELQKNGFKNCQPQMVPPNSGSSSVQFIIRHRVNPDTELTLFCKVSYGHSAGLAMERLVYQSLGKRAHQLPFVVLHVLNTTLQVDARRPHPLQWLLAGKVPLQEVHPFMVKDNPRAKADGLKQDVHVLVTEYVTDPTLLSARRLLVDSHVLNSLLIQAVYTFAALDRLGISHNDAHSNNMFVRELDAPVHLELHVDGKTLRLHDVRYVLKLYDWDWATTSISNTNIDGDDRCKRLGVCHQPGRDLAHFLYELYGILQNTIGAVETISRFLHAAAPGAGSLQQFLKTPASALASSPHPCLKVGWDAPCSRIDNLPDPGCPQGGGASARGGTPKGAGCIDPRSRPRGGRAPGQCEWEGLRTRQCHLTNLRLACGK